MVMLPSVVATVDHGSGTPTTRSTPPMSSSTDGTGGRFMCL